MSTLHVTDMSAYTLSNELLHEYEREIKKGNQYKYQKQHNILRIEKGALLILSLPTEVSFKK